MKLWHCIAVSVVVTTVGVLVGEYVGSRGGFSWMHPTRSRTEAEAAAQVEEEEED